MGLTLCCRMRRGAAAASCECLGVRTRGGALRVFGIGIVFSPFLGRCDAVTAEESEELLFRYVASSRRDLYFCFVFFSPFGG